MNNPANIANTHRHNIYKSNNPHKTAQNSSEKKIPNFVIFMPQALLTQSQYEQFVTNGELPTHLTHNNTVSGGASGGIHKSRHPPSGNGMFPSTITNEDLWQLYDRCDIATTAVDIIPQFVWGNKWQTKIYDTNGEEQKDTELEKQAHNLTKQFNLSGIFQEAHEYARIIGYGLIVLGLADNKQLSEPASTASELSYLTVYSGDEVEPNYEKNPSDEKYGQIISFTITPDGDVNAKFTADATRCIMVYEKKNRKNKTGRSILKPVYNLFHILINTDWSAGEAYFQNASPLYMLSWDDSDNKTPITPTEEGKAKADLEDLNAKKRILKPKSWDLQVVSGSGRIADPQMIWNSLIERIAGAVGVPKQLMLGTSAGALASGETNLMQLYNIVANIENSWATPYLNEFYGRLQTWGILPEGNISVEWGTLWEMDEKEKAQIQKLKVETAKAATEGDKPLMTIEEAREQILNLTAALGGGSKQAFQANSNQQRQIHVDHAEFSAKLVQLKDDYLAGTLTKPETIAQAKQLIEEYTEKRRQDSLAHLQSKGVLITNVPKEIQQQLTQQKKAYLKQFQTILEDAEANKV